MEWTGLFLLAVAALGLFKLHQTGGWKRIGKVVGVVLVAISMVVAGIWLKDWYDELPRVQNRLGKIALGMSQVEVTLALGEGQEVVDGIEPFGKMLVYRNDHKTEYNYLIMFSELKNGVHRVCTEVYYFARMFGLRIGSEEKEVIRKLGPPSRSSISNNGLRKAVTYTEYNVGFVYEKGEVDAVCVTASDLIFVNEYKEQRLEHRTKNLRTVIDAGNGAGVEQRDSETEVSISEKTNRIRQLNDLFRTTFSGGRVMMTRGVVGEGEAFVNRVAAAVQPFRWTRTADTILKKLHLPNESVH